MGGWGVLRLVLDALAMLPALTDLVRSGKVRARLVDLPGVGHCGSAVRVRTPRFERFRSEQSTHFILSRGIEREVLPIAQSYGMRMIVWSLLPSPGNPEAHPAAVLDSWSSR